MALTVSHIAHQAGLSSDAVRYYERIGLLPPAARSNAGYRLYDQAAVARLWFIKGAQRVGLRLREIRELLEIIDRGQCPCGHTEALLKGRLADVDAELARLGALRTEMARLLDEHSQVGRVDGTADGWWCVSQFQAATTQDRG